MNKNELIKRTSEISELSKIDSTKAVEAVFKIIADELSAGNDVKIVGFGNFEVRTRSARKGVNPLLLKKLKEQGIDETTAKTQAQVDIPETKAPAFKAAKALKDIVK